VNWGGLDGLHPTGVTGVFVSLAVSPVLGFTAGCIGAWVARRLVRRARRRLTGPIRRSEWATASALAFSHGANDAQKTMGVITAMLLAEGHLSSFVVPLWVKLVAATALSIGTAFGGWRIVKTVGAGIYRIRPLDGLVSQGASAMSILGAAVAGGPVSTTHVVASSVVGVGTAQRHRHVRWGVVREIGLAWIVTLPAAAVLAATTLPVWRAAT
jgi:PiT family inorganic phosphate transporter